MPYSGPKGNPCSFGCAVLYLRIEKTCYDACMALWRVFRFCLFIMRGNIHVNVVR